MKDLAVTFSVMAFIAVAVFFLDLAACHYMALRIVEPGQLLLSDSEAGRELICLEALGFFLSYTTLMAIVLSLIIVLRFRRQKSGSARNKFIS